jgi:hypothetical protein
MKPSSDMFVRLRERVTNMADDKEQRRFELQEKLMRYRLLEREATDPVACGFLHDIVLELESDLKTADR